MHHLQKASGDGKPKTCTFNRFILTEVDTFKFAEELGNIFLSDSDAAVRHFKNKAYASGGSFSRNGESDKSVVGVLYSVV